MHKINEYTKNVDKHARQVEINRYKKSTLINKKTTAKQKFDVDVSIYIDQAIFLHENNYFFSENSTPFVLLVKEQSKEVIFYTCLYILVILDNYA